RKTVQTPLSSMGSFTLVALMPSWAPFEAEQATSKNAMAWNPSASAAFMVGASRRCVFGDEGATWERSPPSRSQWVPERCHGTGRDNLGRAAPHVRGPHAPSAIGAQRESVASWAARLHHFLPAGRCDRQRRAHLEKLTGSTGHPDRLLMGTA